MKFPFTLFFILKNQSVVFSFNENCESLSLKCFYTPIFTYLSVFLSLSLLHMVGRELKREKQLVPKFLYLSPEQSFIGPLKISLLFQNGQCARYLANIIPVLLSSAS